jgi:hypothetical protein
MGVNSICIEPELDEAEDGVEESLSWESWGRSVKRRISVEEFEYWLTLNWGWNKKSESAELQDSPDSPLNTKIFGSLVGSRDTVRESVRLSGALDVELQPVLMRLVAEALPLGSIFVMEERIWELNDNTVAECLVELSGEVKAGMKQLVEGCVLKELMRL